ncbi:DNA topoisomerase IV, alpha subunit [Zopfia rhizophila CBS 207.26]|uniref:DNA topoisomerase (ATP-hydrolyzing) n=1 Tax=Zopfia rhizophila CBS 207.26 TaxID=1314779 RepID=A0A6A6DQ78_9PEZI|nr:DNA topoisomerase IV, alpha subunit [Zopfia rhizophila CBS 207.26]
MNADGFEEMLFGFPSSQDSLGYPWEDDSQQDEMLDAPIDTQPAPWILGSSPGEPFYPREDDPGTSMANNFTDPVNVTQQSSSEADAPVPATRDRRHWVIARIESMLEGVVDGLLEDKDQLSIILATRAGTTGRNLDPAKGITPTNSAPKTREITFPGSTPQEAWRFTVLIRILELVHSGLVDNVIMTKRDLYYRHPDLFIKQSVVDRYVDDLACTLGVSRALLNVSAAAKGLVAGNFTIRRLDGIEVNGLSDKEGILIPKLNGDDNLDLSNVLWILVIEKEATFRSLLGSPQLKGLVKQGLILTAKGYPDLATRAFLRHLVDLSPHIPTYALVDFDPDGIAIMSTYKHGSYALAHENVTTKDTHAKSRPLSLPQLCWLGVMSHQVSRTPVTESDTDNCAIVDAPGLMRLTPRDRKKARRMLDSEVCAEHGPEPGWRQGLQAMLMLNIKAEMQILEEQPGGLASWVKTSGCISGYIFSASSAYDNAFLYICINTWTLSIV